MQTIFKAPLQPCRCLWTVTFLPYVQLAAGCAGCVGCGKTYVET